MGRIKCSGRKPDEVLNMDNIAVHCNLEGKRDRG